MSDLTLPFLAAFIGTFLIAGLVKGVTGMGLPTVAMGLLGALISPVAAAGLLLIPSFVTNVWQLFSGPSLGIIARRLWPMMVTILVGTIASSALLSADTAWTGSALGCVLIAYALYTLSGRQLSVPASTERWASPLVGMLTGLVTGATGVFVVPAVPYLQALGFSRDDLVQALGLSFTVSTIALSLGLAAHGSIGFGNLALSAAAIAPALAGMWTGQVLRHRISPTAFRRGFLICIGLLGTELALRPLWQ
ncbi:putative membrane protein YfcA [Neorhizobium huautlense]|uniref:Probable membrane transporter protein n=1 Tax=Neorhizobium huautlense TaxID=67774 RepID=A0ABT9PPG0_9HYPH|nr:sulfite exporter TauE/SafE family protein [Neorhizobium huautlense]MDP9835584.1 putative membrane protein YfcA [Neorhizobium huautlense]